MNNEEKMLDELDGICEKVRFAISVGDELTDEMNLHLEKCEKCRTFLEHSMAMEAAFKAVGCDTLTKNGMTVADSVMEEIRRQEVFTKGKPVKSGKKAFRHFGLIAACAVIAVMAFPLVKNGILGSKDMSAEYVTENNNAMQNDEAELMLFEAESANVAIEEEMLEEVSDKVARLKGSGSASGNSVDDTSAYFSDEAKNNNVLFMAAPQANSLADSDSGDSVENGESVTGTKENYIADGYSSESDIVSFKNEELSEIPYDVVVPKTEEYNYYGFGVWEVPHDEEMFESAEDAAVYGALMFCDGTAEVMTDNFVVTYTDDGGAYAIFDISDGSQITVYMKKMIDFWTVIEVCDGNITE